MGGIVETHSWLRYLILFLLIITVINALIKYKSAVYSKKDQFLDLFTMIFLYFQMVLGLSLYYMNYEGFGKVRFSAVIFAEGNNTLRYFTIDHPFGMIIAILLITIGKIKSGKRTDPKEKHRIIFWTYFIGLLIILASIPWPFYHVGTSWI